MRTPGPRRRHLVLAIGLSVLLLGLILGAPLAFASYHGGYHHWMLTRAPHPGWFWALALTAMLLASGCASIERSVEDRRIEGNPSGDPQPVVVWDSNLYPDFKANVSRDCYDRASVGQPVPEGCVSPLNVILEANLYRWAERSALIASLIVIGLLTLFTMRWIGWRPRIKAEQATSAGDRNTAPAEVQLMRAVSSEKLARTTATARGRNLEHPLWVGMLIGVALLVPGVLLFGYGAALGWATVTAVLTFLGLGVAELMILLPFPPQVSDPHVPITRMLFLAGVAGAFLLLALQAALITTPLGDLHGLELFA